MESIKLKWTLVKRIFRAIRRNDPVNAILRTFFRGLSHVLSGLSFQIHRWQVSGIVPVQIASKRFHLYAKADDAVASFLYYGQPWENRELMVWERLCRISKIIFDIGGYNGAYSLVAAAANPLATIVAFEPHPANAARLEKNLALNGVKNVRLERQAVGSSSKTVHMTVPADDRMTDMASLTDGFARALHPDHCHEIQIHQTTIDGTVKQTHLHRLDALKIDVEYYELDCLKGGMTSLKRFSPVILCEVLSPQSLLHLSPFMQSVMRERRVQEIDRLVTSLGYSKFTFGDQGLIRVRSLIEHPDEQNFLFAKHSSSIDYVPYADQGAFDRFLLKALAPRDSIKRKHHEI